MEGNHILKEFNGGRGDSGFMMRLLGENHPKYISVKQQFTKKWGKSATSPPVVNTLQIRVRNLGVFLGHRLIATGQTRR